MPDVQLYRANAGVTQKASAKARSNVAGEDEDVEVTRAVLLAMLAAMWGCAPSQLTRSMRQTEDALEAFRLLKNANDQNVKTIESLIETNRSLTETNRKNEATVKRQQLS